MIEEDWGQTWEEFKLTKEFRYATSFNVLWTYVTWLRKHYELKKREVKS